MELILYLFIFINLLIKPSGYLSCGLFAWNGKYPNSFSIPKFKILGIFNDERGGDSCGVYANQATEKGINNVAKFKSFWKEYDFNNTKNAKVIIGHARKASVGGVSPENAQPIGVSFKTTKGGKKGLILAHNGTLTNHEELAEKYKLNIENLSTDTQVLAYLLHFNGWRILQEYEGSAALIIHSITEPDTMYVFKGASKSWHSSATPTEERPLFYYQENKNSIYFSSIEDSLTMLLDTPKSEAELNDKKIKELPENILFKVKNGVMTELQKIDRSKIVGKTSYCATNNFNQVINKSKNFSYYDRRDEWDEAGFDNYNNTKYNKTIHINKKLDIDKEVIDPSRWNINDYLYYLRFRYYLNQVLINGAYIVNSLGRIYSDYNTALETSIPSNLRRLYFIRGILLKNKEAYKEAVKIYATTTDSGFETYNIIQKIVPLAIYPIHVINGNGFLYKESIDRAGLYYTGDFCPMFHFREYKVEKGDLMSVETQEYKTGAKNYFYPEFEKSVDVFVDYESSDTEYDIAGLGQYEFNFENADHEKFLVNSIKEVHQVTNKNLVANKSPNTKQEKSASEELLEYQIKKLKADIITCVEDYQTELIDFKLQSNLKAAALYNKCEKFTTDITNDLPF